MYLHHKKTCFSKIGKSLRLAAVLAFPLILGGNLVQADPLTLETLDGTIYTEVTVKRSEPTSLSFKHSEGFAKVPSGSLTDESLSKLGLSPADNPEFAAQREDMSMKENLRTLKKNRTTIPGGLGTGQTIQTKNITDINPITILVTENGVPRRIEIVNLPKDIQSELGYDPVKADKFIKAKAQAEGEAADAAGKAKMEQDKIDLAARQKRAEEEKKAAAAAATATVPVDDANKWNAIKPVGK